MNTQSFRCFLPVLTFVAAAAIPACGGGGGSPTSPGGGTALQPGSVVPIARESRVAAQVAAGFSDQVNDFRETAPGVLDLGPFANTASANSTGTNDLGRESQGSAEATQNSTFVAAGNDAVSSLRFVGAASITGSVSADPGDNQGDAEVISSGRSEMTFEFMVDEPGLLLVVDGQYEFTGEEFCVQVYLRGRNQDGRPQEPDLDLDVCEEVGNGSYAVLDTLALQEGFSYELWMEIYSSDQVAGRGAGGAEASSASSLDVDFRILRAPSVP